MSTDLIRPTGAQLRAWRNAVFVVFFGCGFVFASYMARVPHVRDVLGASTGQMSLLMFAIAVGSVIGMTSSSGLLQKFGARPTIRVAFATAGLAMIGVGLGVGLANYWLIAAALFFFGLGFGSCDVAMNLNGAAQEKVAGRTIMPIYHAMFSFGTMAGAGLGALAERQQMPIALHLGIVCVVSVAAVLLTATALQPESLAGQLTEQTDAAASTTMTRRQVWAQPATLVCGVVALGMALAEGSANDWLALAMVDGHQVSNTNGAIALGLFLTAMTIGRLFGVAALDRFGRVPMMRISAICAAVGLAVVILSPIPAAAFVGIVLWGLGSALGFPVAMSAATDDPRVAALRVSAVATLGYLAFLAGPPIIGWLGEFVGLLNALVVVLIAIAAAGVCAGAVREPKSSHNSEATVRATPQP